MTILQPLFQDNVDEPVQETIPNLSFITCYFGFYQSLSWMLSHPTLVCRHCMATVWPLTGCSSHIDKTGNKTNSCPSPSQDCTRSNISITIVPNYLGLEMVHNTCGVRTIKLDSFGIVANKMCVWVFPCLHYNCNVNSLLFSSLCRYMVVFSAQNYKVTNVHHSANYFYVHIEKWVIRLDAWALSVIATATWLGGWLAGWVSVTLRYCIKTAKPIRKLFLPSESPIILVFWDPCADTKFQGEPHQRGR